MGNVTLSTSEVLTTIAGATAIVTAIFHMGLYIGVIWNKLARHEDQINANIQRLADHDDEFKFLKGIGK